LNNKGKCFIWGAGEQNQLGRRVVSRTASGALVPREFGLQRKTIVHIGAGDYHSFAVTKTGDVYAWGLNSFGQCGIPKEDEEDDTVATPTVIKPLEGESIKQISGGAHHSIALTENGKVLVWGRSDNKQCGIDISTLPKSAVFYDEEDRPRYLPKPVQVPNITGAAIATASDTAIVVDVDGKAFSWGFNGNLQTGQGQADDIPTATLIDNTAVRGKKLTWAGVGGQFGVLAGPHAPAP
jgi:regulator of chromosome condensation